jgi:hypothetical protein
LVLSSWLTLAYGIAVQTPLHLKIDQPPDQELRRQVAFTFPVHAHMLRRGSGHALADARDARRIQDWLGDRSMQHSVRYSELSATSSKAFGKAAMANDVSCALKATIDQIRHSNCARNLTPITAPLRISFGGPP